MPLLIWRSIIGRMDRANLCAHWEAAADRAASKRPKLAIHWQPCREHTLDQEAVARAWGLLKALDGRPPSTWPSFGVAIR